MCDGFPIDINFIDDYKKPLFAPEDGRIEKYPQPRNSYFGENIYWIGDSGEKLFLAHLDKIEKEGRVYGGEKIGEIGNSGCPWPIDPKYDNCSPQLHIERCGEQLVLSGKTVEATEKQGGAGTYTSIGQIKKFLYVWEPARNRFEKDYGIGWLPSDVSCIEAKEWTEDKMSILNTDKSICKKAFSILANRYWLWDGTYDGWHKIFFEEFNPSYLQCTAR